MCMLRHYPWISIMNIYRKDKLMKSCDVDKLTLSELYDDIYNNEIDVLNTIRKNKGIE